MCDAKRQLERALETALAQYAETTGETFPIVPILDVTDDPDFWALAEVNGKTFRIRVSTGTADSTATLWAAALPDDEFHVGLGQVAGVNASAMTHISLVWLMLHEMHHFQMGHFDGLSANLPLETDATEERWLVTRKKRSNAASSPNASEISLILEMQADHDATEMLLDAYSPEEWISLRVRVAAIAAVMMLIERADSSNQSFGATHPKAATRIFQLLGHVIDMPMLSAHLELGLRAIDQPVRDNLPSKDEQERFTVQVVVPAFFDAVTLAKVAMAQSLRGELGSATDFFHDLQLAKLTHEVKAKEFATQGARQWAELTVQKTSMPRR